MGRSPADPESLSLLPGPARRGTSAQQPKSIYQDPPGAHRQIAGEGRSTDGAMNMEGDKGRISASASDQWDQ